ncbi:MAG: hypothetical protein KJ941_05345 [Bacteroidetes bacterium]|nr:hypothetical protein [Bacteroidota bacterium]
MKNIISFLTVILLIFSCKVKPIEPNPPATFEDVECEVSINTMKFDSEYFSLNQGTASWNTHFNKYVVQAAYFGPINNSSSIVAKFIEKPTPGEYTIVADSMLTKKNEVSIILSKNYYNESHSTSGILIINIDGGHYFVQMCDVPFIDQNLYENKVSLKLTVPILN